MTRLAVWATLVLLAPAAHGASPDPRSLVISQQDLDRARELTSRLGDDVFTVREQATRDLFRMGRLALPVVEQVLAKATDPEVRARCEWLLPRALADDNKARLDTFLADVEGKYDHDLPGWTELSKVVGRDRPARELFVDMVKHKPNAELLAALRTPDQLVPRLVARRTEVYTRMYGMTPDRTRVIPTAPEVAALVLAEVVNTAPVNDRRYYYATFTTLQQTAVVKALNETVAFRKLVAHYFDSRTDPLEQTAAMNAATNLNLKELTAAGLALRVLARADQAGPNGQAGVVTAYTKSQAFGVLARSGDRAHMPVLRKHFTDDARLPVVRIVNGVNQQAELKVSDFALAMAIALTGQDPQAYGFDLQNTAGTMKYYYYNYSFASDERRKVAFVKWGFWEMRQKK